MADTKAPGGRKAARPVGSTRTQRFRKLACEAGDGCGFLLYASRRQIARAGIFACPACGEGRVMPEALEDAALILSADELEQHPAMVEYRAALNSIAHGQAPHGVKGRQLQSAEVLAMERVERDRRARAKRNRLGAIQPAPDPMPF